VEIGKKSGSRKTDNYGNGMKTLRLRSKGTATVEEVVNYNKLNKYECTSNALTRRGYRGSNPTAVQAWQTCPLWEPSPSHPILV